MEFYNLKSFERIFYLDYVNTYKLETGFVSLSFALQSSRKIAELLAHNKLPLISAQKFISKLGNFGQLEFQKRLLLELIDNENATEYHLLIEPFFSDNIINYKLKNLYNVEITDIEIETDTVWVLLTEANLNERSSEPLSYEILLKNGIKIYKGFTFNLIVYTNEFGDFALRFDAI
ncbi:hypothetical protein GO730_39160 [Spirosoma sp. HMF3257]|uniref:Uncharacterized protein n=1 Tax=Spirosoma telluris TaxID=2183553 RepID=A0A327NCW3_9BACT|nr:hypothetical protein [Spirosoma telluris]RAI72912.1 hypothetical protein HMF3257_39090 [Spirosoma telluris]